MKRKFEQALLKWKDKKTEKPLMVIGARQIGKTYSIREFCSANFPKFIEINLDSNREAFEIFERTIDPEQAIKGLEIMLGEKIDIEKSILFFDEVQVSERFISSLKYFNESERPYRIICAGSLLGVKLHRFGSSFPVGKVQTLNLYPMDFEEFLLACDMEFLRDTIKACYEKNEPLINATHERLLEKYREYLLVGGMPEAVKQFVQAEQDVLEFDRNLLTEIDRAYLNDMTKYLISMAEGAKNERLYNSIPAQLAQEKLRKFKYTIIESAGNKRKFQSSLDWLSASQILMTCHLVKRPESALAAFSESSYFKVYLSDVGLLAVKAGQSPQSLIKGENSTFTGGLTENYVAQQFTAAGIPLYYWTSGNQAEVDFLIDTDNGVIPVEVKAGANTKSKSLKVYAEKYHPAYAIRISSKNFGFENGIKSVPLYAAWCVGKRG